jgi:glyoxylase-like metal-dependent hydrolase (beta-lactamase superfamily II)
MTQEIQTITLPLPYRLGSVNCYLIKTGTGFVLIDTGASNKRAELEKVLLGAGCEPGSLRLIVITHGDFDHTGNAAYLRREFGAPIAMHKGDAGMAERGDMFWGRKSGSAVIRVLAPVLFRFSKSDRFAPDVHVEDGHDFAEYGFHAKALALPGHSGGSVGILTAGGDLFCGDLLDNTKGPALNAIMDDPAAANASLGKLRSMTINMVYPGHGKPFQMEALA